VASLKPKLFCGVALIWREASFYASMRWNGDSFQCRNRRDACCYATIIVKRPTCMVEQRLHTYRTNWTLLLFASDSSSETADYTNTTVYCQAPNGFQMS